MQVNYFCVMLDSLIGGMACIFILKTFATRYKLLSPRGIPLIGGIAIGLSFILACLVGFWYCRGLAQEAQGIIIASFVMLLFGIIDDRRELSVLAKLFVQVIATSLLILFGIRTQIVHVGYIANIVITFIWVLGITNAFNHLDVFDGLAGGAAVIVSAAFFIISSLNGDIQSAILALGLCGPALGFLAFNLPPARIYMGNAGSHFLGFVLSAIALLISYASMGRGVALFSPLLILGLPIFDTTFLVFMRIIRKSLPFNKSNDHLAFRLVAMGYSKRRVLSILMALSSFFAICGILLQQVYNAPGIFIIAFAVLISIAVAYKMGQVAVDG